MIEVAAVTSGRDLPSTRYRIRQHVDPLLEEGIRVREYCPAISKWAAVPGKPDGLSNRAILPVYVLWQAAKLATRIPAIVGSHARALTWLNRELLPGYPSLEPLLKSPLVADVDDAIWLTPPFGKRAAQRIAARSEAMIVGNEYLASWFEKFSKRVHVIPTAIDTAVFKARSRARDDSDTFVVGWIGSRGNLPYLEAIEESLLRFFDEHADARLRVVSDGEPRFRNLRRDQVEYLAWSRATEVTSIQGMDVGLMPLEKTPWAQGKCSFKMLQYMAMEVPVVVSPVGTNAGILALDDVGFAATSANQWEEALTHLHSHREEARRLGANGRKVVEQRFERTAIAHQIAKVFKSL